MKKYIILLLLSVCFYSIHFFVTKHGIYGDGNGYYALVHTIFFQPTLDFRPVYQYLSAYKGASYIFSRIFWNISPTMTGILNCPWLIGTAFFWLPSFFVFRVLASISGIHIGNFSFIYEFGCGLTGILLVLGGLYFIEKMLRLDYSEHIATRVIFLLYMGTQLFYYASFEPALAHQVSFFLVSLILFLIRKENRRIFSWSVLGFVTGLLAITRIGELVLVFPPLVFHVLRLQKNWNTRFIIPLALLLVFFLVGIAPQLLLQKAMYGSYIYNPYFHEEKGVFHPIRLPALMNQLFAARGGVFLWSPMLLLALGGLIASIKKPHRAFTLSGIISLCIYYIFISSWEYIPPAGFGNRFFLSTLPFFSLGIAFVFRHNHRAIRPIIAAAVIWNMLLTMQFFLDRARVVDGKGLTVGNLVTGQITVPLKKAGLLKF